MERVSLTSQEKNLVFVLVGLILVVVILASLVFILPKNKININTIQLNPDSINQTQNASSVGFEISDDYNSSELHWPHMPITYKINSDCGQRSEKITSAFSEIEKETSGSVRFSKVSSEEDINIECSSKPSDKTSPLWEELGEARYNIYSDNGNIISNASIVFYPTTSSCGYFPFVEIHEILHTFGYAHSEDKNSIMYDSTDYCLEKYNNEDIYGKPRIDDDIVEDMKEIYLK